MVGFSCIETIMLLVIVNYAIIKVKPIYQWMWFDDVYKVEIPAAIMMELT